MHLKKLKRNKVEGKLELISRYDEYYLVKSISNEDILLDDILLHNESGRIISVNRFGESNGSKTIMDTGARNPIELVITGNTFKKLIGYYSEYQKLPLSNLSLKNCQAIENGYDLDELSTSRLSTRFNVNDGYHKFVFVEAYKEGFQKALEILGDKKFDEEDILIAIEAGYHAGVNHNVDEEEQGDKIIRLKDLVIPSLQQTQWDVEIEMEYQGFKKDYKPIEAYLPKLDEDGCLILRRKQ